MSSTTPLLDRMNGRSVSVSTQSGAPSAHGWVARALAAELPAKELTSYQPERDRSLPLQVREAIAEAREDASWDYAAN
jgi:hypothetical protein